MGCVETADNNNIHPEKLDEAVRKMDTLTKQYKLKESVKTKIILLGAGESGKSTLLKQMRNLHGLPYKASELYDYKPFLTQNVIESMRTLACYSDLLCDQGKDTRVSEENRTIRDRVAAMSVSAEFTREIYDEFAILYNDKGIQNTYDLRHEFQLIDTTKYLFDNMEKYVDDAYCPTFEDIIHCRTRTIGLNKLKFALKNQNNHITEIYEIYDVGGQKNERRKWLHFFDNTQAIIFVAAISAYNQTLWEDNKSNRLRESLALFRNIVNLEAFKNSSVILFMNKSDIFDEKVGKFPLKDFFPEYTGAENREEILDFFKYEFRKKMKHTIIHKANKNVNVKVGGNGLNGNGMNCNGGNETGDIIRKRHIHFHVTCATDSNCVKEMFQTVRAIVLDNDLHSNGFL